MRSGCGGSLGCLSTVSQGGSVPSWLCIRGSFIHCLSIAIQVHLRSSNSDGSGWTQPACHWILVGNSPSFINIEWYSCYWASSRLLSSTFFGLIAHWTWFRWVLNRFEKLSDFWRILMMLLGVLFVVEIELQGYLFESELTQISISLSEPRYTPPNVGES